MNKNRSANSELGGLTRQEVAQREAAGQTNHYQSRVSRSFKQILRSNVFTLFNAILICCLVVTAIFGHWPDLVFGIVMVVNALTGIVSETRAKITLEKMSILDTAPIEVIREGTSTKVPPHRLVRGDLIHLRLGDQIPADGEVLQENGFRVNESNLSGESVPQHRQTGQRVLSGSAVVSGSAYVKIDAVGAASWANQMSAQVKRFALVHSELQSGIDKILRVVSWLLPAIVVLLLLAQVRQYGGISLLLERHLGPAVVSIVAAIVGMIPQGLVLLTSVNFAASSLKLARKGVLVQELPAVEVLARVDTLCLDKTGTLTTGAIRLQGFVFPDNELFAPGKLGEKQVANLKADDDSLGDIQEGAFSLGQGQGSTLRPVPDTGVRSNQASSQGAPAARRAIKAAPIPREHLDLWKVLVPASQVPPLILEVLAQLNQDRSNATAEAIQEVVAPQLVDFDPSTTATKKIIPFDSSRKYSALCQDHTLWVLGAPEIILGGEQPIVQAYAGQGARVIALGRRELDSRQQEQLFAGSQDFTLPALKPVIYAVLGEELRADAADTLRYFQDNQVQIYLISGDNPLTVAALARRVGLDEESYDARDLPENQEKCAQILTEAKIFGRVTPEQKHQMVKVLRDGGRTVAMTGDGVNDALALKDADLGIAMGNATSATKAAAKIVLVKSQFSSLPAVVSEGRRVLGNMERVSTLFLSKTTYAMILALVIGVLGIRYPYLPRQFTLIGSATIGIPAFFLALAPSNRRYRPGFLKRVGQLVIPAGSICGVTSVAAYLLCPDPDQDTTVATITLALTALVLLGLLARPLLSWRIFLLSAMASLVSAAILVSPVRRFFALTWPSGPSWTIIGLAVGVGSLLLILVGIWWEQQHWRQTIDPPAKLIP